MLKLRFSRQHFDSLEDNPDMPCEFGEAHRKRVRHMFPFLGFPLAMSINENSNSGWYHLLVCGTTPWMIHGYGEIRDVLLKHFGRKVLWTKLKLCPDKERSSWREQHIAWGTQTSLVQGSRYLLNSSKTIS
ncbi:hypothetical protein C4D60_Mb05t02950 [Musa balbisiana]|uniref:Uncharacterized protein n=1 Tax=Musa balbisiana TaxID=52838 RepID=A0A4S8JTA0_MUSBA|nr:hypothetical protein C4D60_Mb05t02950 [Musa balbisiana]